MQYKQAIRICRENKSKKQNLKLFKGAIMKEIKNSMSLKAYIKNKAKEYRKLENNISLYDLTDSCRTLYPTTQMCMFIAKSQGKFTTIEHMLGHKTNLDRFKRSCIKHQPK